MTLPRRTPPPGAEDGEAPANLCCLPCFGGTGDGLPASQPATALMSQEAAATGDDLPALMSKEAAAALARGESIRHWAELERQWAESAELERQWDESRKAGKKSKKPAPLGLSKNQAGPVVATVVDRRTGELFTDRNDPKGRPPDPMHWIIEQRVQAALADPQHFSTVGSHAEVYALNRALIARDRTNREQGLPPVTEAELSEFTMAPAWLRGSGQGMVAGEDAPRCGNCQVITDGVHNVSGDAPRRPPQG